MSKCLNRVTVNAHIYVVISIWLSRAQWFTMSEFTYCVIMNSKKYIYCDYRAMATTDQDLILMHSQNVKFESN